MLLRRHCFQLSTYGIGNDLVAVPVQVNVAEGPVPQVPAAWLRLRALLFFREKLGKYVDKALALAVTPFAPDLHLPRIDFVVDKLSRPRVNHNTERDVPLREIFVQQIHLALLFRDAGFYAKRRETQLERLIFDNLAISPARALQIENVSVESVIKAVVARADQNSLDRLPNIICQNEV